MHHLINDVGYLGLEFFDELLGIVCLVLNVAQLLLPDARQLAALEQFLVYEVYEFNACRGGHQTFLVALDIMALKKSLDDAGAA